mgnify:FL=1
MVLKAPQMAALKELPRVVLKEELKAARLVVPRVDQKEVSRVVPTAVLKEESKAALKELLRAVLKEELKVARMVVPKEVQMAAHLALG